jgi:hypothetical protein
MYSLLLRNVCGCPDIPDLKEFGYIAEQFLQNNYNQVCRR